MVECCFTSTETVGLLGTGGQDGHLGFYTVPELWPEFRPWTSIYMDLYIQVHGSDSTAKAIQCDKGTVEVKLQALVYDILLPRVPEREAWSVDG